VGGNSSGGTLDIATAEHLSGLALKCLHKEYPNKLDHVMNGENEVLEPHVLHPAFYGCYDWHSSVHGHWMLVRILKTFPAIKNAQEIRAELNKSFTTQNINAEIAYLAQANRKSFERTYGWAWLLKLSEELHDWNDADGILWNSTVSPLAEKFVLRFTEFLPNQVYPIRTGVHPNTAFALGFALDYARKTSNAAFEKILISTSLTYFLKDTHYPLAFEPSGEDFFSPALMEASLLRRVLPENEFRSWLVEFFGKIDSQSLAPILIPAIVSDRTDPKLAHLDGLNLSRAWCLREVASAFPAQSPERDLFEAAALKHEDAAVPYIASGNYEGDHWLASFAIYLLTGKL